MACEGYSKGKVIVTTYEGKRIEVISNNPPMTAQTIQHPIITDGQCLGNYYTVNISYQRKVLSNGNWTSFTFISTALAPIVGVRARLSYPRPTRGYIEIQARDTTEQSTPITDSPEWITLVTVDDCTDISTPVINSITPHPTLSNVAIGQCGNAYPCQLIISDQSGEIYNSGLVQHTDGYHCPSYQFVCGDDCPAGTCKCPTKEHPYYCCLDCNSTAQKIQAIANSIKP